MIVLNTNTTTQQLKVLPRAYPTDFFLFLRDDSTNSSITYAITNATIERNYLVFENSFNLIENHFYDLKLETINSFWNTNYSFWQLENDLWNVDDANDQVIYKDKIFCTNQDITNNKMYELNKNQYEFYNGYNNEYIVR